MKTILCFGDSLTWGYDAEGLGRHPFDDRWTSAVAAAFQGRARVIVEGLNGRTTAYDDHLASADRNGARLLPTLLATHEPIDVLVIALGTNDLKRHTGGGAAHQAIAGVRRLIDIARTFRSSFVFETPRIALVSPPAFVETSNVDFRELFGPAVAESRRFKAEFARLSIDEDCLHVAASDHCSATPIDGVHLDAENTRALGRAIAAALQPLV